MNIGIISDGNYGERARDNIKKVYPVEWILVPDIPPTEIIDERLPIDLPDCNMYISYVKHPDIVLQLVETQKPFILAILAGKGQLRQAQEINPQVVGVPTMCSLEPTTKIKEIDDFARHFGRPEYSMEIAGDSTVTSISPAKSSPCGSTGAGATFVGGKKLTPDNLREFSLAICHECRAPRFGHTCDKEVAGLIHLLALARAIPTPMRSRIDAATLSLLENMSAELKMRLSKQA
jgi:hypothetical protein